MAKKRAQTESASEQLKDIVALLKTRFESHQERHEGILWPKVAARLAAYPDKLPVLQEMERTGGEPDVVGYDEQSDEYIFFDCSPETPQGRRSVCYDREGLESRKEHRPANSAVDMAAAIGIELLTEQQYRDLQALGTFDTKTSSWLMTPPEVRELGGAIFGDCRYGRVFIYHNGAQSYYGVRGFRGSVRV